MRVRTLILLSMLLLLTVAATQAQWQPKPEQGHQLVSRLQLNTDVLAVRGDYLYAGDHDRFVVVDITDLKNPTEVGELTLATPLREIAVTASTAFVGLNGSVVAIDITNPTQPQLIDTYTLGAPVTRIMSRDNHLLLISGDTLYTFNVIDPANILEIDQLQFPTTVTDLDLAGANAFVLDSSEETAHIVNISDLTNLEALTHWQIDAVSTASIQGSVYFATASTCSTICHTDILTWDVSDIDAPVLLDFNGVTSMFANAVEVSEIYAYLGTDVGLYYFDISDPSNLPAGTLIVNGQLSDIVVQVDTLFAAVSGDIKIYAVPPIKRTFLPIVFQ